MTRRTPVHRARWLLAPLLLAACGARPEGPSVVLITLDTTRADYLSCYGYPQETTPNLDRLAREGTRFDLAVATSALTPVSHASILTGRFNREHGLRVMMAGSGFRLPDEVPTLATEFRAAGYATLAVQSALPVCPHFGLTHGFDVVEGFSPSLMQNLDQGAGQKDVDAFARRSDESVDIALRELGRVRGPFFLWLHLWDPHDGQQPPPAEFMPDRDAILASAGGADSPEARRAWMRALYAAELHYMDAQIGRLIGALERRGVLDDTIIAVTADHGQGLGDHDWALHRILYQEQLRVPLIVRVPGLDPVDAQGALVRTIDVAPTLLDFAGLSIPAGVSGRSLRALMVAGEEPEPRLAFADQLNGYDLNAALIRQHRPQDDFSYVAMDARWKLVWRPNHPDRSELFHLEQDPGELENLWSWDHPEARRLRVLLGEHAPWVARPYAPGGDEEGESLADALESLGYAGDDVEHAGPDWEWVCPEDYAHREPQLGRCSHCARPLLLIVAGA